jgi:hypothetical protein
MSWWSIDIVCVREAGSPWIILFFTVRLQMLFSDVEGCLGLCLGKW